MTAPKMPFRFNNELKKAVHSGDGYEDYKTVYQFLQEKIDVLQYRLNRMQKHIDDFYGRGGTIESEDGSHVVSIDASKIRITYDGDGDVTGYSVEGLKGRREYVWYMLGLFFSTHLMPIYGQIVEDTREQLRDIDNDNILRGIAEVRDLIRGDRYLTSAAVSNMKISAEEDVDPFGIYGGGT